VSRPARASRTPARKITTLAITPEVQWLELTPYRESLNSRREALSQAIFHKRAPEITIEKPKTMGHAAAWSLLCRRWAEALAGGWVTLGAFSRYAPAVPARVTSNEAVCASKTVTTRTALTAHSPSDAGLAACGNRAMFCSLVMFGREVGSNASGTLH
jgi:hypothetical protein